MTTLVHLADIHFGRDVDLDQIRALETLVPELGPSAIVLAGDLTQRARHGELQAALRFRETLAKAAPVLVIPGNHDVEWWRTPLGVLGTRRKYAKYRRYFGPDLTPTLELPGLCLASVLTSHGVVVGSLSWKLWRDTAVKGHLPAAEMARVGEVFRRRRPGSLPILVLHHNLFRGAISRRMGLVRWRAAQAAAASSGAELILDGHDHQEAVNLLGGQVVVATAGTHCSRIRGGRPSAFNVIEVSAVAIAVRHYAWNAGRLRFVPGESRQFERRASAA